jgi:DNA processing protein
VSAEPTVESATPDLCDALALSLLPGVGPLEYERRLSEAGSPTSALARSDAARVQEARVRASRAIARGAHVGAQCVLRSDPRYPDALRRLRSAPPVLWMRGTPGLASLRSVAIVGTRTASSTGLRVARSLAAACAEAGIGVVSGLALGIDGAAHSAALESGGSTVAVLGTGVDVPYPPRHRALQERVATDGLLLSEVLPGERGHAGTFPQRNRLIAALADITVVVEAGRESGALITARVAQELDRTVCAVPGSVLAPECAGSNALIQQGAQVLCSPDDLLAELGLARRSSAPPALEGDAAACWDALQAGTTDVVTIATRAGLDLRRANVALSALELHGLIEIDAVGTVRPLVSAV